MTKGMDRASTTSSVCTLSSKVQLAPAECDTCLETQLVWIWPCCNVKICLPCLETYLEGKISDGIIDIPCPGHSCDTHLTPRVITQAVDTEKAKRFSFLHVKSDRCWYKKACPLCNHVVSLNDIFLCSFENLESIITCPQCSKDWCFQCTMPWHEGYTCAEYKTLISDTGVDEWAEKFGNSSGERNAQQCPKCKAWIQKISGCYLMRCSQCKTKFCYMCGVRTPHPEGDICAAVERASPADHAAMEDAPRAVDSYCCCTPTRIAFSVLFILIALTLTVMFTCPYIAMGIYGLSLRMS